MLVTVFEAFADVMIACLFVFPCDFDEKIEEKIALFFFHLRTFSGWELVLPVDNTVVKQTFF